ncbi:hypothetical protein TYRP_023584 [Tyrophagus putrescentiae]|nr:hypothetical protein TYRP_023584 [Tyrophagus putrescentiae]
MVKPKSKSDQRHALQGTETRVFNRPMYTRHTIACGNGYTVYTVYSVYTVYTVTKFGYIYHNKVAAK